jgi:hypothetical protein
MHPLPSLGGPGVAPREWQRGASLVPCPMQGTEDWSESVPERKKPGGAFTRGGERSSVRERLEQQTARELFWTW